jgi:hypothetical protein
MKRFIAICFLLLTSHVSHLTAYAVDPIGFNTYLTNRPAATTIGANDLVPVVQGGVTKKAAYSLFPPLYTLPAASANVLGGVKVGTGLTIASGVLSVTGGGGGGGGGTWGTILGQIADQYDLIALFAAKADVGHTHTGAYEPSNSNIQSHVTDSTYHLTSIQKTGLTGGAATALHTHTGQAPSSITQDASNRFVTDTQISTWTAKQAALGYTPQNTSAKGQASGYAGLDSNGKVPAGQLPIPVTCTANQTPRANSTGTIVCAWVVYHAVSSGDETAAQALDPPPDIIIREDLLATGPLPYATLTGLPAALTNATTTDITVGGSSVISYKYAIDSGSQSAELATSVHIALSGLVAGSHTLSVVGKNSGGTWQSNPTIYTWTIDTTTPITTPSPAAGTYDNSVSVSLSPSKTATIRYTTDGSTPNGSSSIYTSSLTFSVTTTLKYFATDSAGHQESVVTSVYTINHAPTISGTPSAATQGVAYSWSPTASDPDGNSLTFASSGTPLPTGLSLNTGTGAISGTLSTAGTTSGITLTVSDGRLSSSITVSIVVAANSQVYDNITVYTLSHGTVSPASPVAVPADSSYNQFGSQTITYSSTGYHISSATISDGTAAVVPDASRNYNNMVTNVSGIATASVMLWLSETLNSWPLTTTQGSNVSISPSAITAVGKTYNTTYTVTPTPSSGYNPYYAVNGGAATIITGDTHIYTIPDAAATVAYTAQAIPVPSGFSVTGGSLKNTVSWSAVSGANVTGYKVQGSDTSGGSYADVCTTTSAVTCDETSLGNNITRYYKVRANTTRGSYTDSGAYSSYASGATLALNAPASPSAAAGNTQNTITWSAPSGATVASYNIKWGTSSGSRTNTITGVTSPYTHSSLTNGTAYYYSVVAVNTGGTAGTSEISATPAAAWTFDTFASGSGGVTTPGGGVIYHLSAPGASDTANMVYATAITKATHTLTTRFNVTAMTRDSSHNGAYHPVALSCATSKPTTRGAAFTPNQGPDAYFTNSISDTRNLFILYQSAGSTVNYWNGTTWVTTSTPVLTNLALNTVYTLVLETTSTQWRYTLQNSDGSSNLAQSGWVDWTSIYNIPTSLYLFTDLFSPMNGTTTVDVLSFTGN